jgi:AcrR family transcriptional regulator
MKESTPRQRRHARTKQSILKAARKIIARQGEESLSMRRLAKAIDYSPSGLYKYFGSKEEIIDDIRREGFERLAAHVVSHVDDDLPPRQMLIEAGMAYLDFADANPEYYILMFNTSRPKISVERIGVDPVFSSLTKVVEDAITTGEIKLRDGYSIMTMLYHGWVTLHGITMLRLSLLQSVSAEFDAFSRPIVETVIESLIER